MGKAVTAALAVWLASAGAYQGAVVVEFDDGRTMEVESVRREGDSAILVLGPAAELGVPASQIVNWPGLGASAVIAGPSKSGAGGTHRPVRVERWREAAGPYAEMIAEAAHEHRINPILLTAMVQAESAFDPRAVSPKGAQGLLQLMPATADRFGVTDAFDAGENIRAGAAYFSWLLDRFGDDPQRALAGYNAGEGAVERYGGIPPYRETRNYVEKVLWGAYEMLDEELP